MTSTEDMNAPAGGSGQMFDRIANRYDLLNRIISLGLDRSWRKRMVESAAIGEPSRLLDIATGTGDVALDLARTYPSAEVLGLDPSVGMLGVGTKKVLHAGLSHRVHLVEGDAQNMPFEDNSFDGCTIAFGIRNVPDRAKGLAEMNRVLRPGTPLAVLELSEPDGGPLAPFARFHVHHVVPTLGGLLSGSKEYRYLQKSIADFPAPDTFADMMRHAGFRSVRLERMSFGAAHLYVGHAS